MATSWESILVKVEFHCVYVKCWIYFQRGWFQHKKGFFLKHWYNYYVYLLLVGGSGSTSAVYDHSGVVVLFKMSIIVKNIGSRMMALEGKYIQKGHKSDKQ